MDTNDVARLVEELRLSAKVEDLVMRLSEFDRRSELGRMKNLVVGKIFDIRVVNRDTLKVQLPRILQTRRDPTIEIVGDNLFEVEFGSAEDRRRALGDGPWNFFRNLMLFKELVGLQHPSEVCFDVYSTWIQIHNVPIAYMQPAVIRGITERVGTVLEVDVNEGGNCLGHFTRARVSRPVEEPLKRCVRLALDERGEDRIVLVRYEKLLDFCFACGRVGHVLWNCEDPLADKQRCIYGQWLRAGRAMDNRRSKGGMQGREPGPGVGEDSGGTQSRNSNTSNCLAVMIRQDQNMLREGVNLVWVRKRWRSRE